MEYIIKVEYIVNYIILLLLNVIEIMIFFKYTL
nr:MAG TPA: hypothetical protein [Caudoviricetes sp.]